MSVQPTGASSQCQGCYQLTQQLAKQSEKLQVVERALEAAKAQVAVLERNLAAIQNQTPAAPAAAAAAAPAGPWAGGMPTSMFAAYALLGAKVKEASPAKK